MVSRKTNNKTLKAKQKDLSAYRAKRHSDGTNEPFGGSRFNTQGPLRFVVHHHGARSTHYDLRLEIDGVLRSWAVPKGPSPNVQEKRFAALVEDHPLEYLHFEGKIPEGNYGAGWSIIWDTGFWRPIGDPVEGQKKGKILFELQGCKLHGNWTLVRMKQANEWLFIKEFDEYDSESLSTCDYVSSSVFSGLSLDDLHTGRHPLDSINRSLARLKTPKVKLKKIKPMLAKAGEAFDRKGWVFEIKYDGCRLICRKDHHQVSLISRNGNDLSLSFPDIVEMITKLPCDNFTLDGEVVVHDESGLPQFSRIQKRLHLTNPKAVDRATRHHPATFYAFDLLSVGEYDLRSLPLLKRKAQLKKLIPENGLIKYSDHIDKNGIAMFNAAADMGLEGIVGKKADASYQSGRSDDWIKVAVERNDDFVIMGYRESVNANIRSLLVGQFINGILTYSGSVGSGLNETLINTISSQLGRSKTIRKPAAAPDEKDFIWKQSQLVCEIRYKEFTPSGYLRHPVFLHLRDDKHYKECTRDSLNNQLVDVKVDPLVDEKIVVQSNRQKVYWPSENLTKGDMLDYYTAIGPWILPWLKDRPVVLTRYPDGIEGKFFYQQDASIAAPSWMRVEKVWSESRQREISYFMIDDLPSLLYVANLGSIPLHVHQNRLTGQGQPDWCILDLDPKDAPFSDVVKIARFVHKLCDEIGLANFVKTTGSTGLHILLPTDNQLTFENCKFLGELLARITVEQLPEISTIERNLANRQGKVYVDFLQNGSGKLLASAYCVRAKPGAPVSMPIHWREVNSKLRPDSFTIKNSIRRLNRMKQDPGIEVLTTPVNMIDVLETLSSRRS